MFGRPTRPAAPMPPAAPASALRPRVFLLFAIIYLFAFPYFNALRSANELPRVLTTQEIVERGTFRLDARMREVGSRFDLAPTPGGHFYQNKAPGPSLLAVPTYLVLKLFGWTSLPVSTWAFRVTIVILPTLAFLFLFYRLGARFSPSESARRTGVVAFALGSPAMPYALLFMSHEPSAVWAGTAFVGAVVLAREESVRRRGLVAAGVGVCAGLSVIMDYQSALAAAAVGVYLLVRSRSRLRDSAAALLGASVPIAALLAYHKACFGGVLKTGYSLSNVVHERGVLGLVGPSAAAFYYTLVDPSNGLLVLAPWVVLAPVGFVVIMASREARRRVGAEAIVCMIVFVGYLTFMGSLVPSFSRAGWCVGPRYMTVALPFVAWLAVAGFGAAERWLATRVLALGLVLASVVIFVTAATTYPHWPENLRNPIYELVFRLITHGYAVHSLGTLVGLRGLAAMLPLYLFTVGFIVWLLGWRSRRALITTAAGFAVAAAIVAGYSAFPRTGQYAEHAFAWITSTWEPPAKR